jgi:hypothetical protein
MAKQRGARGQYRPRVKATMRPRLNPERDAEIRRDALSQPVQQIAERFGLSPARVYEILRQGQRVPA